MPYKKKTRVHHGRIIRIATVEKDSSCMTKYGVCMFVSPAGL